MENLDLNAGCIAASYPNMSMYTHIIHPGSMFDQSFPS
jgi:hypothetical protein